MTLIIFFPNINYNFRLYKLDLQHKCRVSNTEHNSDIVRYQTNYGIDLALSQVLVNCYDVRETDENIFVHFRHQRNQDVRETRSRFYESAQQR